MTRFTEFYNKQKNIIKSSIAKRLESSIPISEERDAFYKGELFKKYDIVESEGKQYTILEQASNYYHVVDSEGNLSRKFAKQLTKISECNNAIVNNTFHGYKLISEEAVQFLNENYSAECDDVGILKQVKQLDEQMDSSYKAKDKMTVAKIIADAVGVPHDMVSTPENLVAAAIRKAKKDPKLVKNKEILANMLQIAKEVGIKVTDETFEVKESEQLDEISDAKKAEYIHAARKSIKKLDAEGNDEKRDQRSVTANKTYSTISKEVKRKAFGDMRESEELDEAIDWSPGVKDQIKKDKIQSLKNLISSYKAKKNTAKVAELEKELEGLLKESADLDEGSKFGTVALAGAIALGGALGYGHTKGNAMLQTTPTVAYNAGKALKKKINAPEVKKTEKSVKEDVDTLKEGGLSRKTIDSYLEKAKASKPGTIHKAIKRFAGQERAQDRVHKDELEKMKTRLSLKEMRAKLSEELSTNQKVDKANDTPDADVEAKQHELPHGHSMHPSNEIHRKQLIRKVRGDD